LAVPPKLANDHAGKAGFQPGPAQLGIKPVISLDIPQGRSTSMPTSSAAARISSARHGAAGAVTA
jgi:hypothetical protein